MLFFFFFFFQAEDGIRDRDVTGVQTCALPIYPQPSQVLKDLIFVLGPGTLPISVLNPENVSAVLLPREKPRKQAGPHVANMKQACRTGCETNSNHGIWKPEGQTQKI